MVPRNSHQPPCQAYPRLYVDGVVIGIVSRSDLVRLFALTRWSCETCGFYTRGFERLTACPKCGNEAIILEREHRDHNHMHNTSETRPRRVLLFVPGHRASMVAKARAIDSDAIVFDLEDSVPLAEKQTARDCVAQALVDWPADGAAAFVRINAPRFSIVSEDANVVLAREGVGVLVPKVDRPAELLGVFDALGTRERELLVNIETPRALLHAEAFADTHGVDGLFLGGEDLTLALGAQRTSSGHELATARFILLLATRAAGIAAYDTIFADFRDLPALEADARVAADLGFDGKFAIHPAQIATIRAVFTPSNVAIDHARKVVDAYDSAVERGSGAVAVDGQMVDPPVAERARALLRRAGLV